MKKILLFLTILLTCFILTGCGKDEEIPKWETDLYGKQIYINEEALEVYNNAMVTYSGEPMELIALLGDQVVAGKNYMYLCKDSTYKIIVIYKDINDVTSITNVKELDISNDEEIVGGWHTEIVKDDEVLNDHVKAIFASATSNIKDATYLPITLVSHQEYEGTNYAVLAYGTNTTKEDNANVYLITINENTDGKITLKSIACVDLGDIMY